MANDTDPKPVPPDPDRDRSDPPGDAGEAFDFDLEDLDLTEIPFESLPDPLGSGTGLDATITLPVVPEVPLPPPDDAVSFDDPVPSADPASFTRGMSLDDLSDLHDPVGDLPPEIPTIEPPAVPLAAPASMTKMPRVPADAVGLGDFIPAAEAASTSSILPADMLPPDEITATSSILDGELGDPEATWTSSIIPEAGPASGSGVLVAEAIPEAGPVSGVDITAVEEVLEAAPVSGTNLTVADDVPEAGPGSGTVLLDAEPVPADVEPVVPVEPASGWLDAEGPTMVDEDPIGGPLKAPPPDPFAAPVRVVESSDIFSSGPPPSASPASFSDVIAATINRDATPADAPPKSAPPRPSEIALSFDQPPGGSTVESGVAGGSSGNLPVAEEIAEERPASSGNLFPSAPVDLAELPFDSARLAATPDLPAAKPPADVPDFGATPNLTPDASSILADLAGTEEVSFDEDASAVRLDAPGIERTLSSNPEMAGTEFDLTIPDEAVPPELLEASAGAGDDEPTDWRQQSGSDLFADARTAPEIDLGDYDSGRVDPIDADVTVEQPSLTSAPSSIFTGMKAPENVASGGSSQVPTAPPPEDEDAAVEFTDFPTLADPEASSAALLGPPSPAIPPVAKAPASGAVDFDLPKKPATPETTLGGRGGEEPDSGLIDWASPEPVDDTEATLGLPASALDSPPSSVLKRGKWLPAPSEPTPVKADPPKAGPARPDPSIEFDWVADGDEDVPTPAADSAVVSADSAVISADSAVISADSAVISADSAVISADSAVIAADSAVISADELAEDAGVSGELAPTLLAPAYPSKESPAAREKPTPTKEKAKPAKEKASPARDRDSGEPRRRRGGWVGGTLVGGVLAASAFAGLYFGDVIPNGGNGLTKSGTQPGTKTPDGLGPVTVADARGAISAGDPAKALQILEAVKKDAPDVTPEVKVATGRARVFARLQELAKANTAVAADDAELKKAREELEAVVADAATAKTADGERAAADAALTLGRVHEDAGDRAAAKAVYEKAIKDYPNHATKFRTALRRLAADEPEAADGTSRRPTRGEIEALVFAVVILQPPTAAEEPDAGDLFYEAVEAAKGKDYKKAIELIRAAKVAHEKRAKEKAGSGLYPQSDPRERIFAHSADRLVAYWTLQEAVYKNKLVGDLFDKNKAEPGKAFDELAAASEFRAAVASAEPLAALLKKYEKDKDGVRKAAAEFAKIHETADQAVKLMTDLKDANAKLLKAETDLKDAAAKVIKTETDLTNAKADLKKKADEFAALEVKAKKEFDAVAADLLKADTARKASDELLAAVAVELQGIKLLKDKYGPAELMAAMKVAANRASGPNLNLLIPGGAMAVGGGGLSAAQLLDVAGRLEKAEAAAREATEKFVKVSVEHAGGAAVAGAIQAAELVASSAGHAAELNALKAAHAADVKAVGDKYEGRIAGLVATHAAELVVAEGSQAARTGALLVAHAADVVALEAARSAAVSALLAEHAAEFIVAEAAQAGRLASQAATHAAEFIALTAAHEARVTALDKELLRYKAELANAMTPAQALDVWLPLLTDLRREADADPALLNAAKVLGPTAADPEDKAKAQTVSGLAFLLKRDLPRAKALFQAAKASPAYAAAAGKAWAKAADVGLESVDDPLHPFREPVKVPPQDPAAAVRFLDAGIQAYKAGRYGDAIAALTEAAKNDEADPVSWYFLGAARWALGGEAQARDDFRQGAEREKVTATPARTISGMLAPIQGPARGALAAVRP